MYSPVPSLRLLLCCIGLVGVAHATITAPPTLDEVVAGSEHLGLATIQSAENYGVSDRDGDFWCGVIYEAEWLNSLTGDTGRVTFVSRQILDVRGLYLLFLADQPLPRKLVSTNSRSEAERSHQLQRELGCERTRILPRTIFPAASFVDESFLAEEYKTGRWVPFPRFSRNTLHEIVIMPTELSIDGEVIPRDRFLTEFYDEYKHQVIRTAGYELIIFRAVDWNEYCSAIIESVRSLRPGDAPTGRAFCELEAHVE